MRKKLLSILLLLVICFSLLPQGIVFASSDVNFWSISGSSNDGDAEDESCEMLFDGSKTADDFSKWRTRASGAYVIFEASEPAVMSGYTFTTCDNTESNATENPKAWTLYGCNDFDEEDETSGTWAAIHTVTNDTSLKSENYASSQFQIDDNNKTYQYYKLEINETHGSEYFQLGEMECFATAGIILTAVEGTENSKESENYDKLVDGKNSESNFSKWCYSIENDPYVVIKASKAITVYGYVFTTGNDNKTATGRNPKSWTLYACNNYSETSGGDWVEIHKVTDDTTMNDENYAQYKFYFSNSVKYQYYKLVIHENHGDKLFQLGEMSFICESVAEKKQPEKKVTLGFSAIDRKDFVYLGTGALFNIGSQIKWRVISLNGNGGTYETYNSGTEYKGSAILLLSELAWSEQKFDESTNVWRYSDLRTWCKNRVNRISNNTEDLLLLKTSKDKAGSDARLISDTLFLLSRGEVGKYGAQKKAKNFRGEAVKWWSRTTKNSGNTPTGVKVYPSNISYGYSKRAWVRPALNIKADDILFTTPPVFKLNCNGLTKNEEYDGEEYQLTVMDASRKFKINRSTAVGAPGHPVKFDYENAATGKYEYISAMVTNLKNEVLYYGRIKKLSGEGEESGTVEVYLPTDIGVGNYKLHLFNEENPGSYRPVASSPFQTVDLTVKQAQSKAGLNYTAPDNTIYDGIEKTAIVTKNNESLSDIVGIKYYIDGNEAAPINVGTYTVKAELAETSELPGAIFEMGTFTITPKDVQNTELNITLAESLKFNGKEQVQKLLIKDGEKSLTLDTDYTISNATATEVGEYYLTVSYKGNYSGVTENVKWSIADATEFSFVDISTDDGGATAKICVPEKGMWFIIFADFEDGSLFNVESRQVTAESGNVVLTASADNITLGSGDKIMLWSSLTEIESLCDAYVFE